MTKHHGWAHATLPNCTEGGGGTPGCFGLMPCAIVALGTSSQPTEPMMRLQSGFYRFIVMLEGIRFPRLQLPAGKKHLEQRGS